MQNEYKKMEAPSRGEYTDMIYETTCFGTPTNPETAKDVMEGINRAIALGEKSIFLEGLSERLTALGSPCTVTDTAQMLDTVNRRFRDILGKPCPRAVQNWIRGTTPGVTNRQNLYDLCCALEMGLSLTEVFFQKYYLTIPFYCKDRIDAVYYYALYHKKSYAVMQRLLEDSKGFSAQETAHTATAQIGAALEEIEDDAAFLRYLSAHCYHNEQQYQLTRSKIIEEVEMMKAHIRDRDFSTKDSSNRLNSMIIAELLGYRYQSREPKIVPVKKLPRQFTKSLPNDVTLGRILRGESASYETLRKTLMLLKFYNFYENAENTNDAVIISNLMDFHAELNETLEECGLPQIYERHPFDCLLLYCANSYDPILAFQYVNEYGRNENL